MKIKVLLGFCGIMSGTGVAQAQEVPVAEQGDAAETAGDIIVTASKRAQNLQLVPIAVTAVAESRLQSLNLTSLSNLSAVAPSIVFVPAPNPHVVQFVVRGIGTYANADTLEQSVGVAIDGVPLGRLAGAVVDAVDVARVEVLRGPQGTTFGKSATAGLISVVTNKPELDALSGSARGFYGETKEFRVQGTVNVPLITDTLAVRVSGWDFSRDGYLYAPNQRPDRNIGDFHNRGGRIKLAWQATPDLRFDLGAEISDNSNDGLLYTTRSYLSSDRIAIPGGRTIESLNTAEGVIPGPRNLTVSSEAELGGYVRPRFYTAEVNWDLGGATLTALTGYRTVTSKQLAEFDYSNSVANSYQTYQRYQSGYHQLTSEVRLANAGSGPFQYTAGLFYYDLDVIDSTIEQTYLRNPTLTAAVNYSAGRRLVSNMNTKNYAAFADTSYRIGKLKLIAGARLSREISTGTLVRTLPMDGSPTEGDLSLYIPGSLTLNGYTPLNLKTRVTYTDFSWRAGAQFQVADEVMTYATASRAYKGPGFNFANDLTPAIFAINQGKVDPEIAHSYEAGVRSRLFDRLITLNLSAYYTTFDDFQITAALPGTAGGLNYTVINAGQVTTKGLEAEFGIHPRGALEGLTVDGNASYTDAYYSDFTNAPCYVGQPTTNTPTTTPGVCAPLVAGSTARLQSVNGFRTVGSPKWQLNLFAGYDRPVTSSINGFVQAHYFSQSDLQLAVGRNPLTVVPGYHTVDLTLGVRAPDNRWKLSVIARNLFDQFFITRLVTSNPGLVQVVPYEAFRSVGVALDVKF
jgi:iron complex outermembrane receptor protein